MPPPQPEPPPVKIDPPATPSPGVGSHGELMDQVYHRMRHVYDLSRRYYLVGRDRLLQDLDARPGERICEIGCGTARNLIRLARAYPECPLYGIDASREMLRTAEHAVARQGLTDRIHLAPGLAEKLEPGVLGLEPHEPIHHFVFSYSLTMIPPRQEALDRAFNLLPSGGRIHIVDFGDLKDWPAWARNRFFHFLANYHVFPSMGIHNWSSSITNARATRQTLLGGYAYLTRLQKQ